LILSTRENLCQRRAAETQGESIYFFSAKIPLKAVHFEEKIHRKEEGRKERT
jgi:hypothetical protein